MRKLIFLLPVFVILFYSCGLLDSGGMNPPDEYYVYHVYSIDLYGDSLKALCNGSEFALSSTRDTLFYLQNSSIYSISLDDNSKHMVTPPGFSVYNFSFSASNNEIYLGLYYQPYIINPDGSGLRNLNLPDSAKYLNGWAVSSSRKYVAYSYATGLFLMYYDGTKVRLLKDSSNSRTYEYLTFTTNDSAVVYIQDDHITGKLSLKLFNFFNSTDTTLFPEDGGNHIISYSVSRWNTILFVSTAGIYILDLSTLSYDFITDGSYPHYSEDGTEISYIILDTPGIYIYNLVSRTINHIEVDLPGNYLSDPQLSNDNNRIIFEADSVYYVRH